VIEQDAPLEIYRNPFLAEAMVNLNMIDTQGGGIKRMFMKQRERFFPMPDYDLSQPERVMVKLRGHILDERYTRVLMSQSGLELGLIMLLDKVQKGARISADESRRLKVAKLVEGRYPNLMVAGPLAALAGQKAQHIRNRGLDSRYYRDMIVELVREHQPVSREDIDRLLLDKLPEVLSDEQKLSKVHNLISSLSGKAIRNAGTRQSPRWILIEQSKQ
jgi:ATP-dependent DNA helicase RecG